MSFRTWLGPNKLDWADFNLCEYNSLNSLANDMKWLLPANLYSPSIKLIKKFLIILAKNHSMTFDDFWKIWVTDADGNTLREYTNTPTKTSIEMGKIVDTFIKIMDKND